MRAPRFLLSLVVAAAAATIGGSLAGARVVARPKPPKAPAEKPAVMPPPKPSTSFWEPLVLPGARFDLAPKEPGSTARIVVETYDHRTIKGAKVARLRWTVIDGPSRSPMGNSLPTQIAVSPGKGVWLLTDRLDDAAVTKALKGKPTFTDPPRLVTSDDTYVRKDADTMCIGVGTAPGGKGSFGVSHAEYCLAKGEGLVALSGNHTPGAIRFEAPRRTPTAVGAPGTIGIPECDAMVAVMQGCLPHFPPEQRQAMEDAIGQMSEAYRQAAQASPDARQQIGEACLQADAAIRDSMRSMGCPI